jgi:hypothetical protein
VTVIRRFVLGTASRFGTATMTLNLNLNLALDTPPDMAPGAGFAIDARAQLAADFIPAGSRVLDLSPDTALQALLPNGCSYQSRDSVTCDGGAVCDIAGGDFPTQAAAHCDIVVMLGVLERVANIENLFTHLRFCKQDVVLSYSATDLAEGGERAGFANALSFYDLAVLFDRYGYRIECSAPVGTSQVLMRLTPTERLQPVARCSVAVVSCNNVGNFGDRLGYHMINALLPGEAEVHHLTFQTLHEARAQYDLVVLGIGNSLFKPLLGDDVLDIVSRGKAAIAIFGTQYRELIPRLAIDRVLDRLDTWFARHEDDVLLYGRGRNNVVHVGDWLIDQFPMTRGHRGQPAADHRRAPGGARARPRDPSHPAAQGGVLDAAATAAVRAHFGGARGLCRAAIAADAEYRVGQVPQHADRRVRPQLSGTAVLPGRPRRGHPLQSAHPPQPGQGRRADRRRSAQCGGGERLILLR